jgi:DNA-binding response OmpR family regulator
MREAILVVEDEVPLRQAIQWMLEDEGLTVQTAGDGREALDIAATSPPALVVLDMAVPLVDGFGVAAGLRQLYGQTIPIMVVTADGRAAEKARKVKAFNYLQKPFDLKDLVAKVREGLARG